MDWVNWATFDVLDIKFGPSQLNLATGPSTAVPQNWSATTVFRVGAQWDYLPNMRARVGYIFDPTPLNDTDFSPRLPGNDRQLLTAGYGYDFSNGSTLDVAYAYLWLNDRTMTTTAATVYHGLYKAYTHLFALSYAYRF